MKPPKPKSKDAPRFDVDTVREIAGEKVFARGEAYFRGGSVQLLAIEPKRVLGTVSGTEDYRVALTGRGKKIDGECSCPAFEDSGFCKHMVAAALAANEEGSGAEAEGAGTLTRIRDYLKAKGADALVEMIVEMAERDPALFRKLDMAAATRGSDKTLEARLRKGIDAATRTGGFVEWREAASWAEGVDEALEAVAGLASDARADIALRLAVQAIDRIENALNSIDDSNGHCGALLERARDIHLAAARSSRPCPVELAHDIFAREMKDGYDTFHHAVQRYAEVLGDEGLAEYRRLAAAAWEKLPPRPARPKVKYEYSSDYSRLIGYPRLLRRARRRHRCPHRPSCQGSFVVLELLSTRRVLPLTGPEGGSPQMGRRRAVAIRGRAGG